MAAANPNDKTAAQSYGCTMRAELTQPLKAPDEYIGEHITTGGFRNPWPSFTSYSGMPTILNAMFFKKPKAVPVPEDPKDRPVQVIKADFATGDVGKLRATWLGHASWLLRFPQTASQSHAGLTVLFDPLFSERTSPVSFMGPKRYSEPPCNIQDLPHADIIAISHNHYDHCDLASLQQLWQKQRVNDRPTRFFVPCGNKPWFLQNLSNLTEDDVVELDWWEGREMAFGEDILTMHCTPAQHSTARTAFDKDKTLWCSWTLQHKTAQNQKTCCFFAGDTAYRTVPPDRCQPAGNGESPFPGEDKLKDLPTNPTFEHIGRQFPNGLDLAMLPIGLFNPIEISSKVHASPWDSVEIHKALNARTSLGMHFGTVRGGLSGAYEPIDLPVKELAAACHRKNIVHGKLPNCAADLGHNAFLYCNIGYTVAIPSV